MSLYDDVVAAQQAARKAHEEAKLNTIQLVLAAIKNERINSGHEQSDDEVQGIIQRQVKQLRDALNDFIAAGRQDLIDKAKVEIALLESYLPAQMSDDELETIVRSVIAVNQPADAGKVMGKVMGQVKGKADGNRVRAIVTRLLSAG